MIEEADFPRGEELEARIKELGLSRSRFAELVGVKEPTVGNWIKNPRVKPSIDAKHVLAVLHKGCRTCGQFTEKADAWDNSTSESERRGKGQKRTP